MNTNPNETLSKPLKDSLFEKIEADKVCPRSRLYFWSQECTLWSVWFLSVMVGALAVAVSLFVVFHRQYEVYEVTHENMFTFMVEVLPYVWILTFFLMVAVAVFNIRQTKRGYRYPLWFILSSSVVLSFAGGSALQFFGLGFSIDNILGSNMDMYMSQDKIERRLWQSPDNGRLIGMQVFTETIPTSTVLFEDISGQRWTLNINELHARDLELLAMQEPVRLLGECVDKESRIFHACEVFPWMLKRGVTADEMLLERQVFIDRFHDLNGEVESIVFSKIDSTDLDKDKHCAGIIYRQRNFAPQ